MIQNIEETIFYEIKMIETMVTLTRQICCQDVIVEESLGLDLAQTSAFYFVPFASLKGIRERQNAVKGEVDLVD